MYYCTIWHSVLTTNPQVLHYALKVDLDDPLLYQTAYLSSELRHLMRPETDQYSWRYTSQTTTTTSPASAVTSATFAAMLSSPANAPGAPDEIRYADTNRKKIDGDCGVCYMELRLEEEEVGYCAVACGNNLHVNCMRMWAVHQGGVQKTCPFCRSRWT
jgi:hypothetical protein